MMTKEAKAAYDRAYRAKNPEKIRAKNRAWTKANREKRRASYKTWKESHLEKVRAYDKAYRAVHSEERRAYSKAYKKLYPEKGRAYASHKRGYGFNMLNTYFPGSVAHHVSDVDVVFISEIIHTACSAPKDRELHRSLVMGYYLSLENMIAGRRIL